MVKKHSLHLASWNINGYKIKGFNKYEDQTFLSQLNDKDIICLIETHCPFPESINIPNFKTVNIIRPKNKRSNKISGGMSILVKTEIRPGVKYMDQCNSDFIWLKLCKNFFGLIDDIYLCFMYNPPAYSSYTKSLQYDIFDMLEKDILNYSLKGKILLMGDLNSRTAEENDFIQNDHYDCNLPLFEDYLPDCNIDSRFSMDRVVLPRGRALNDICIQTGIRILNGRCLGDLAGKFTCHNQRGSSVVDYGLASENLLPCIKFFKVNKFIPDLSDHCLISLMLKINCRIPKKVDTIQRLPNKYKME